MRITSAVLAVLILTIPCQAATIYVNEGSAGTGSSWADAYGSLQDALDAAVAGNNIFVGQGTYVPDTAGLADPREATFQMKNGVNIIGGFAGYGTADPDERNVELFKTILSGDLAGDDGPDFDNNDENSYHVVTGSQTEDGYQITDDGLDGFTVTGGNANGSSYVNSHGGGMYVCSNSNISNCTFTENFAVYGGGAACLPTWCCVTYPNLDNCTFIGNSAEDGGGMFVSDSDALLTNCVFIGNSASSDGGAVMYYMDSIPILNNCLFSGNQAAHDGGGIFLEFGFNINITNSTFGYNSAGNLGGGIYRSDSSTTPQINNCILWGNTDIDGADEAAQIYLSYGSLLADYNCIQGWTGSLGGTANHGEAPLFVDADGDDDIVGTKDDNLRLSAGSPCIDAGDNDVVTEEADLEIDLDGNPRIVDGDGDGEAIVDMGAYEAASSIELSVDIKPGACPNPVNVKSKGMLPVAILGTEEFEVSAIDVASIFLNGVQAIRSSYEDVGGPVANPNECECTTDGPDGFDDLVLKFKTQDIVEALGQVNTGDILTLTLTGVLNDGTGIEGTDCVVIRGKHKPINKADINKDGVVNTVDIAIVAENWLESSIVEK